MDHPKQERRNEARPRALKRARITFKGRRATIDCTVLNLSNLGACLKVESPVGIPDTFDLVLDNAPVRGCRVIWRNATQIGVAFRLGDFPGFALPGPALIPMTDIVTLNSRGARHHALLDGETSEKMAAAIGQIENLEALQERLRVLSQFP